MWEEFRSESETEGDSEKSSSDEQVNDSKGGNEGICEYEKQRIERIRENRARLEALRLPTLASSLLGSLDKKGTRKGKEKKKDDDEEYKPSDDDQIVSPSSSQEDEESQHWSNGSPLSSRGSVGKGKVKQSNSNRKKNPGQKHVRKIDFIDDEEALQQAIALSLAESSAISGAVPYEPPQNCRTDVADVELKERKGKNSLQETDKRKKRRKFNTNRVQITEDQVIIHFFQFDDIDRNDIAGQHKTFGGMGTQKFQCKYCGVVMGDGCVTDLMQHLAGTACEHVPHNVVKDMRKCLSEREDSHFGEEVRKEKEIWAVGPQEDAAEDPDLRLQQDIEEATRRSMNDPEYKEMEEIKIAMLESQRLDSHTSGGASSCQIPYSTVIIEDSDEELDQILGFNDEG